MRSMVDREVWRKTERKKIPNDRRLIGNKWVFKIERDGTYRARLVALGYSQIPGVDCTDNLTPVAHEDCTCKDDGGKARQPSDGCGNCFPIWRNR